LTLVIFFTDWLAGCCVIAGAALTVTVADPDALPLQKLSLSDAIEYVVVADGETLREIEVDDVVCVTPSDHVTLNGAQPLSDALTVDELPAQIVPPPLTAADGGVRIVTVAEPPTLPLQCASLIDDNEYVAVVDGVTMRLAVLPEVIVCVSPSDHVTVNGAVPLRPALIVADCPGQMA
jgi:hypothetical protein